MRTAMITGKGFLGRTIGWKAYKLRLVFEGGPRLKTWSLPPAGSHVSFDALFSGYSKHGIIDATVHRILGEASAQLVAENEEVWRKTVDRFLAMRQARAAKRNKEVDTSLRNAAIQLPEANSPPQVDTSDRLDAVSTDVPDAPMVQRGGISTEDPPSPSPGLLTRKRAREIETFSPVLCSRRMTSFKRN